MKNTPILGVQRDYKKIAVDYIVIFLAAIIYALSFILFVTPNKFAPAGVGGITTMVQYKFNFSIGYMYLLINVPLCIAAFFGVRRKFAFRTLFFVVVYSIAYLIFQNTPAMESFIYYTHGNNTILAALAAGTMSGYVYALTLKRECCTGGTDIIARFVQKKNPEFNMVWVIFILNSAVAAISYFVYAETSPVTGELVFDFAPVILCIVYCLVSTYVCDAMLAGNKAAVKFEVITEYPEKIAADVINELHHTATVINARGMYKNDEKKMLICVVGKRQVVAFRNILDRYPGSFAYLTSVSDTVGLFRRKK